PDFAPYIINWYELRVSQWGIYGVLKKFAEKLIIWLHRQQYRPWQGRTISGPLFLSIYLSMLFSPNCKSAGRFFGEMGKLF
ncbi:MAG: hypothetical protein ACM3MD_03290, partial [Betaproteobacteria bacterium]